MPLEANYSGKEKSCISVWGWEIEVSEQGVLKMGHVQNFNPFVQKNLTTFFLSNTGKQILLPQQANIEKRETQTVILSWRKTIRNWMSAIRLEQETSISAAHYRIQFCMRHRKTYGCTRARFRFFSQGCLIGPSFQQPLTTRTYWTCLVGAGVRIFSPFSPGRWSWWSGVRTSKPEASWGYEGVD